MAILKRIAFPQMWRNRHLFNISTVFKKRGTNIPLVFFSPLSLEIICKLHQKATFSFAKFESFVVILYKYRALILTSNVRN